MELDTTKKLSPEQQYAFDVAIAGKNIFFTGSAGTGKSYLLCYIIDYFKKLHRNIYITALTGIAAINISGSTLHSFAGIGIQDRLSAENILRRVLKNKRAVSRWKKCQILIIDEISMMSAAFFEKLNYIAQHIREKYSIPFGGIQLILSGDFFQLPPIKGEFCFKSQLWDKYICEKIILTTIFRQRDMRLINILAEVRYGDISDESLAALYETRHNNLKNPVRLYATNREAEYVNSYFLSKLSDTETRIFHATDIGNEYHRKTLENGCIAPTTLKLKKDCSCIFLKNKSDIGVVNGELCKVIDFDEITGYPIVRFKRGKTKIAHIASPETWELIIGNDVVAYREQIPLKLSYAITIHKSQSLTFEELETDLKSVFENGQVYVCLSRAVSLGGLRIMRLPKDAIMTNPEAIKYMRELEINSN